MTHCHMPQLVMVTRIAWSYNPVDPAVEDMQPYSNRGAEVRPYMHPKFRHQCLFSP